MDRYKVTRALDKAGVNVYLRKHWQSNYGIRLRYVRRRATHRMPSGPAKCHFLHITVTNDTDTVAQGKAGARQIESFGLSSPKTVSYQDLVTNEGKYFQGQDYGVKGTHTVNNKRVPGFPYDLNSYGYATAIMQNVGDPVTDIQVKVIAMIFAARELGGYVRRDAPIYPHRKFAYKSCPGDRAVARMDEINRLKRKYVREGLPSINPKTTTYVVTAKEAAVRSKKSRTSKKVKTIKKGYRFEVIRREGSWLYTTRRHWVLAKSAKPA